MVDSLKTIAKSTGLNMFAQVSIRLLSFLINAIIIRFVSIEYVGVVNVRLTLLVTTSLFLAREPIRKACLDHGKEKWVHVNQLSCILFGVVIISILSLLWIYVLPDPQVEFYKEGVFVYAISSLITLSSESSYILTQLSLHTNIKVFVESTALTVRSFLNCLLLFFFPALKLKAFCIAELVYALCYPTLYFIRISYLLHYPDPERPLPIQSIRECFPQLSFSLPKEYYSSLFIFFKQSVLKQVLTEGEKYILSLSSVSMHDQGVYEIVNNLGSLFARFLFQPLEEGFYLYFSRDSKRNEKNTTLLSVCLLLLRCLCYFGCLVIGFGMPYASALLFMYGGEKLATPIAITMLRVYCVYVLFLGLNGISEAFFMATAETTKLEQFNIYMAGFSVCFVLVSLYLHNTPYVGSVGYIIANGVNMLCRCIHHFNYIRGYSQEPIMNKVVPSLPWLVIEVLIVVLLEYSEQSFTPYSSLSLLKHLCIGGTCGVTLLILLWVFDKTTIRSVIQVFGKQKQE